MGVKNRRKILDERSKRPTKNVFWGRARAHEAVSPKENSLERSVDEGSRVSGGAQARRVSQRKVVGQKGAPRRVVFVRSGASKSHRGKSQKRI